MKRVLKSMPIALLTVLFVLTLAFAVLIGTTVLSNTADGVAEAYSTLATLTLDELKSAVGTENGKDIMYDNDKWQISYIYKDSSGNIKITERDRGTSSIFFNVPSGSTATGITYSLAFDTSISLLKVRAYGGSTLNKDIATSGTSFNGTLDFGDEDVEGGTLKAVWIVIGGDSTDTSHPITMTSFSITIHSGDPTSTVTLNRNGASNGSASVTATYGSAMPSATMPTRTGYTFQGYYDTSATTGGTKYYNANGTSAKNWDKAGDTTLWARWTANQYSITYKDQGNANFSGSHASGYPTTHTYGTATTLKSASKTGYTFGGWFTNQNCTGSAVTSLGATAYTANITLYAKWTANQYNITYKDQGNANFSGSHASGYPTKHTYGTATTLKSAEKAGYTFGGWFINQNCSGSATTSLGATAYTNDITLYAKWTVIPATAPTITSQPTDYTGDYGGTGTLSVSASAAVGHTLSYQWYCGDASILGETNATFNVASDHVAGVFSYYCAVTATRTDNNQTNTINSNTITVTVNKVDPTPIAEEDKPTAVADLEYTGSALTLANAGEAQGGDVWYSIDGENFSATIPTATNTGTYTVYYMIHGDGNHNDMSNDTWYFNVTISPVDKTELADMIVGAQTYYTSIVNDYPDAAAALLDKINTAITIRDDDNQTTTAVSNTINDLLHAVNVAHANVVDAIIDSLPDMSAVDYSDAEAVEEAREKLNDARDAYDLLSNDQKAEITKLAVLEEEEAHFMDGRIGQIPATITVTDKDYLDALRDEYDALSEGAKANVTRLADLEEAEVDLCKALIDAIGAPQDTQAFRDAVEAARDTYDNGLNAAQKALVPASVLATLTDDEAIIPVMDEIGDIGTPEDTQAFRDKVDSARENFDALSDDQEALFPADVLKTLTDDEAIVPVMDEIKALGDYEYTEAFGEKLENACGSFAALSDDQKALFPSDAKTILVNDEKAFDAMTKIEAIGKPVVNSDATRENATAAREAVDALTVDQLALVDPDFITDLENAEDVLNFLDALNAIGDPVDTQDFRNKVVDARDLYDALEVAGIDTLVTAADLKVLTDDEAIVPVMDEIDAIGAPEDTDIFRGKVEDARDAYDALTDDQKDIFPEDVLKTLEDDEAIVPVMDEIDAIGAPEDTETFRDKVESARESYDALTDDQKDIFPADVLKTLEDDEAIIPVMDEIDAIGTPEDTQAFRDKVDSARENFDALSDDQEALFPADVLKTLTDDEAIVAAMDKVNAIGDVEYPEDEDALKDARDTYNALTGDQKAIFPADVLKTLEDKEATYDALGMINAIGDVELTPESKEKIDDARAGYNALTDDQKALVDPAELQKLIDAEKAYEAMDKINDIGSVQYTPESKALINAAREYYDTLSDVQKAAVDNYADLTDAERDYDAVKEGAEKITAIDIVHFDEEVKEAIMGAREEYEALSVEQKAFFPEETLQELINKEKAIEALEKIAAIGDVSYNEESEDLIRKARETYDDLTDEQKALVHLDDVNTLSVAEDNYAKLHSDARVTYTVLLVFVCILLLIGLLILAYLVYRIMKDKKKDTGVMSVAFFPMLLGASHYVDSPFLALYILAALTVLVFVADIILAIKHPKIFKSLKNIFKKGAEREEEPQEEPAPVEDVKKEEPITLKQSMSVAKHSVHSMKWNKKVIANDLRDRHAGEVEINERENYTSTGLPLADTHYAVDGKTRKCFIYVYETEGAPMLLINSDADLAEELNKRHGNVHKSAFPKSKDFWFSLPLDDSYSQEEVQSILDRCHAYALGRDEKEFSLKESLALAKNVKSAHSQSKKSICEYLEAKYGDQVELNTRDNYTSTGLPLADTHYVKGEDGKSRCFVYVYETEGSMMLLTRSNYDFAKALKENHENVHRSAFPKAKEPWNMVLLDDSFSDEEVHELLDKLVALNK